MAGEFPTTSFSRQASARFLVGGAVVCGALFLAHVHLAAALCTLVTVAVAGALRRSQEHPNRQPTDKQAGAGGRVGRAPAAAGMADRETLESTLDAEWQRDLRPGEPTALLLIGMDAFEQLEEHGGMVTKDVARFTLASALARSLPREADLLARYDDSTFAVMLRGTDLPGSLRVAARLRWAVVRLGIAHAKTSSGFLTACMGLAVQHGRPGGGTAALLAAAQSSLETAQQIGHDTLEYVVAGSESRPAPAGDPMPTARNAALPAIRAWTPEPAQVLHSPQG